MTQTRSDVTTDYRYRAPVSGEVLGVHEAARRAGEMLTNRGEVIQGALLTAEYHTAIVIRDGMGEALEHLKGKDGDGRSEGPKYADMSAFASSLSVLVHNALGASSRMHVYLRAFAPEFQPIHPENLSDHSRSPSKRQARRRVP